MKKILLTLLCITFAMSAIAQKKTSKGNTADTKKDNKTTRDSAMGKAMERYMGMMMGNKCKAAPSYYFQSNLLVGTTSYKGKDTTRTKTKYFVNDTASYNGYIMIETSRKKSEGDPKMTGIYNFRDSTMVMLMDQKDRKTGTCHSIKKGSNPMMGKGKGKDTASNWFKGMVKTGRTKTICGLLCEEYQKVETNETRTLWMTKEANLWIGNARRGMTYNDHSAETPSEMKGMMMEMTITKKSDNSYFEWKVLEVNKNVPTTISTAEYTFN